MYSCVLAASCCSSAAANFINSHSPHSTPTQFAVLKYWINKEKRPSTNHTIRIQYEWAKKKKKKHTQKTVKLSPRILYAEVIIYYYYVIYHLSLSLSFAIRVCVAKCAFLQSSCPFHGCVLWISIGVHMCWEKCLQWAEKRSSDKCFANGWSFAMNILDTVAPILKPRCYVTMLVATNGDNIWKLITKMCILSASHWMQFQWSDCSDRSIKKYYFIRRLERNFST